MIYKKGRNNRLNIGDQVSMRPKRLLWELSHFNEMWLIPGQTEIDPKNYPALAGFLHAHLSQRMPVGIVVGFGDAAMSEKSVELKGQSNVRVDFKFRFGRYNHYFNERDLSKLRGRG